MFKQGSADIVCASRLYNSNRLCRDTDRAGLLYLRKTEQPFLRLRNQLNQSLLRSYWRLGFSLWPCGLDHFQGLDQRRVPPNWPKMATVSIWCRATSIRTAIPSRPAARLSLRGLRRETPAKALLPAQSSTKKYLYFLWPLRNRKHFRFSPEPYGFGLLFVQ